MRSSACRPRWTSGGRAVDIELIRTLLTLAQVLWVVMALLLVAAAVALLVRARARYGLLVASCSCAAAFSLAWIVLACSLAGVAFGVLGIRRTRAQLGPRI